MPKAPFHGASWGYANAEVFGPYETGTSEQPVTKKSLWR